MTLPNLSQLANTLQQGSSFAARKAAIAQARRQIIGGTSTQAYTPSSGSVTTEAIPVQQSIQPASIQPSSIRPETMQMQQAPTQNQAITAVGAGTSYRVPFTDGLTDPQKQSITNLVNSNRVFNETDAKNYAFATGAQDYQQFVGKTGAQLGILTPTNQFTATAPVTTNLDANILANTSEDLAMPNTGMPSTQYDAVIQGIIQMNQQAQQDIAKAETERSKYFTDLRFQMASYNNMGDRAKELENEYGIGNDTQKLKELNLQIAQKVGEYQQANLNIERQPIPLGLIRGQQAELQRQQAIDISVLQGQAEALRGNLDLSYKLVDRAIELEFEPIRQQIENTKFFIQENGNTLSRAEQKQMSSLNQMLQLREQALNQAIAEKKSIRDLMLEVVKYGGDPTKIDLSKTYEENLAMVAPDLQAAAKLQMQSDRTAFQEVDGRVKLIDKGTGKVIADLGGAPKSSSSSILDLFTLFNGGTVNSTGAGANADALRRDAITTTVMNFLPNIKGKENQELVANNINRYIQNGELNKASEYLESVILSNIDTDARAQYIGRENAITALTNIESALQEYIKVGGDTGLLAGSAEEIARRVGRTNDPRLIDIATRIQTAIFEYRRAMSGASFTETETRAYENLFPSLGNIPEVNSQIIGTLRSVFESNNENLIKQYVPDDQYNLIFDKKESPVIMGNPNNQNQIIINNPSEMEQDFQKQSNPGFIDWVWNKTKNFFGSWFKVDAAHAAEINPDQPYDPNFTANVESQIVNQYKTGGYNFSEAVNTLSTTGTMGVVDMFGIPAIQTSSNVQMLANAIGQYESGGNYQAIGPETGKGRAYGKYQIMDFNIPSWTKEALGYSLTPQQFLADEKAQDMVAMYKMSMILMEHKNAADVASVWFSGRPLSGNTSTDILGTSVPSYVKNIAATFKSLVKA